jgi:O-antigen/teichoic acid export membrane protein
MEPSESSSACEAAPPPAGAELRRRAAGGAALLGGRAVLILCLGVGANILLARLLAPEDFGLVALGTSLILLGAHLAEGGLGAALIRRPEEPERRELEALNGLQLAATAALTLIAAAVAAAVGGEAPVVALMVATLPITVLRTPSVIVLERRLHYRPVATTDTVEAVVFYAWALVAVALGMGVWGVATAAVARAVAGTAVMLRAGPLGLLRPRWAPAAVRPLVGLGARIQVVGLVTVAREQALNAAVAAVAGMAALGVWNLALRVITVPFTLFTTVSRIAYPTLARVIGAGGDVRAVVERGLGTVAVASGAVVAAVGAFAPALPALVGPGWSDLPATLLWSCVALLLGAPSWVILSSYLYAADEAGAVVTAATVHAAVWLAVAVPLVAVEGAPMVGVGWIAAAVAGSAMLWRGGGARTRARVVHAVGTPTVAAFAALAAGWAIGASGSESVVRGLLAATARRPRTTLSDPDARSPSPPRARRTPLRWAFHGVHDPRRVRAPPPRHSIAEPRPRRRSPTLPSGPPPPPRAAPRPPARPPLGRRGGHHRAASSSAYR